MRGKFLGVESLWLPINPTPALPLKGEGVLGAKAQIRPSKAQMKPRWSPDKAQMRRLSAAASA